MSRLYTRLEVITAMCEAMYSSPPPCAGCVEQHLALSDLEAPLWRLVDLPLDRLHGMESVWSGADRVQRYAARRLAGEPFPPIVVEDWHGDVAYPYDGNHRVRAAKLVGDRTIRAFVPADQAVERGDVRRYR